MPEIIPGSLPGRNITKVSQPRRAMPPQKKLNPLMRNSGESAHEDETKEKNDPTGAISDGSVILFWPVSQYLRGFVDFVH
jgi:hypothetical protein